MNSLKAPFPWFGGKSRCAPEVWAALGDVPNYVEPFAGSLAVLLARPHEPKTETVNDLDCYLANFWRALQAAPTAVEHWCDSPVNEADLSARHQWLVDQAAFRERMKTDPDFYDAKIAGWWVWGVCSWIGTGWCSKLPHLGNAGRGVNRQLPHLGDAGTGVHRSQRYPLGDLAARLRRVRVACGDWRRVLGDSVTWRHGVTGVFLDPPYSEGEVDYSAGGRGISADVREWALEAGKNPKMRVVLAGYEGEHEMPSDWRVVAWKAKGGYGNQGGDNANARRERLWMSPACLSDSTQFGLFGGAA